MSEHVHPTDLPQAPPPQTHMIPQTAKELRLDLTLAGDPGQHREGLHALLLGNGWNTTWDASGWSGVATKGNKVMNFLFGAFAQYHEMTFSFATQPDGSTGLTVYRSGDGCMGGLYGMYKVKKSFKETASLVEGHFQGAGTLLASRGQ